MSIYYFNNENTVYISVIYVAYKCNRVSFQKLKIGWVLMAKQNFALSEYILSQHVFVTIFKG